MKHPKYVMHLQTNSKCAFENLAEAILTFLDTIDPNGYIGIKMTKRVKGKKKVI